MTPPRLGVLPPLPPGVYARRPQAELPFPLGRPGCELFARGRHALWQGVQGLGLFPGDAILTPAYHHGSEVEALLRAGLECRFYDATATLEPDEDELERLLGPRVRALYLIHYLGHPQDGARWRRWCDERDLLLLEDAAQAWLAAVDGQPVGSFGDLAIFCLYKSFGLPDGGALMMRPPTPGPESPRPLGLDGLARRHAAWFLQRMGSLSGLGDRRRTPYVAADDFALGDPGLPPTSSTLFLLPRIADDRAASARRANYTLLREELGEHVPPPYDSLHASSAPFALPFAAERKDAILTRLAESGVAGLDLWSEPHPSLPVERFPGAAERRERIIGLPVHQELRPPEIERVAAAARGPAKRRAELQLQLSDSFDDLRDEWQELAEAGQNVFSTHAWATVWWRQFGRGRRPLVAQFRDRRGSLVAIVPLYLATERPLRMLRFVGHGPGDQLGPVCAPSDRPRVGHALARSLDRGELPWDVFLGEQLPGDEAWASLLGARTLARDGYPVLRFAHSDWEVYLASRSASFRKEARRAERRLVREHKVAYRLTESAATLEQDLDALFALHRMRWSDDESPFGSQEQFHRAFAAEALERGWLYLSFLEIDGAPVAGWYGFRFAGVQFHYQSGRDPAWDDASVGYVLVTHSVREALEDGMREYRFLRGRQEYKYHFANADPGLETVGLARGPVGNALLAASARMRHLPALASLRHLLTE